MRVYKEMNLRDFEFWSGAMSTFARIEEKGKVEELEDCLDELFPHGIDATALNDFLWFEDDYIFELLGIGGSDDDI